MLKPLQLSGAQLGMPPLPSHSSASSSSKELLDAGASPAQRIHKCNLCDAYGCEGSAACEVLYSASLASSLNQGQRMRRKYISLLKRYAKVEGLTSLKGVQNIHKIVNTVTDVILTLCTRGASAVWRDCTHALFSTLLSTSAVSASVCTLFPHPSE